MSVHSVRPAAPTRPPRMPGHWHRRVHRPPSRRPRLARLARTARLLSLLLVVTGCAVEGPRPIAERLPPGETGPGPAAPAAVLLVPPPIMSGFGERTGAGGPRLWAHAGVDIRLPVGTPVLAAADGVVARTGLQTLAGKLVVLVHGDALATVYYHLSEVLVAAGQVIRRGTPLGRSGATGNATAPHLHFGVCRREGGLCGEGLASGWEDPVRHWVAGDVCFRPEQPYPEPERLTYPAACAPPRIGSAVPAPERARAAGGVSARRDRSSRPPPP